MSPSDISDTAERSPAMVFSSGLSAGSLTPEADAITEIICHSLSSGKDESILRVFLSIFNVIPPFSDACRRYVSEVSICEQKKNATIGESLK